MEIPGQEATPYASRRSPSPLIDRRDLIRAALFASAASALGPAFSLEQAVSSELTPAARSRFGMKSRKAIPKSVSRETRWEKAL